jgi:cytochrome c oxidase assembly factor CtaG
VRGRVGARAGYLAAAAAVAGAALCGPVDRLADDSFAWHMFQHLVLLFGVPLLALLARPFEIFAALAGKPATAAFVRATRPLHVLAEPPLALLFFIATLWLTHFSALYELSLEHSLVHAGEHLLYLVAGTLFWIPVLAPPPLRPMSYPARLLYLLVALPQGAFLGMALASAHEPLYAHYASLAGRAGALADQSQAAAVMWVFGGLVVLSAFLATLGAWAHREGRDDAAIAIPRLKGDG